MSAEPTLEQLLTTYLEDCGGWEHRQGAYLGWIDKRRLPFDGLRGITLAEAAGRQCRYEAEDATSVD